MSNPFIDALLNAMPTAHSRMVCVAVLSRYAGESVYIPAQSKAERRLKAATNMLENKAVEVDVVHILRERFQISARTAWRDLERAKKLSVNVDR